VGLWLILCIMYYIKIASTGQISIHTGNAGIEAVEDAVGRATEMGRSVFICCPEYRIWIIVQTVGRNIYFSQHIAKKTAEYETKLMVPSAGQ